MFVDHHLHLLEKNKFINSSILKKYCSFGEKNRVNILGFSEHFYLFKEAQTTNFNGWQLDKMCYLLKNYYQFLKKNRTFKKQKILIGLEVDYSVKQEREIKKILNNLKQKFSFDFFSGSIHWIDDWGIDLSLEEYQKQIAEQGEEKVYCKYYQIMKSLIQARIFDFINHFDLIKIFSKKSIQNFVVIEPILKLMREYNVGVEVNTNGMNKPIKELYPSLEIIKKCIELKIPITLSSDAHSAERVGENFYKTTHILKEMGLKKIFYCKKFQKRYLQIS